MNKSNPDSKPFELSNDEAEQLAQQYRATDANTQIENDPFDDIDPSLLSSEHIEKYVRKTGLIAPFNADTSKSGRLKKASYAGYLGECAYHFEVPDVKEKRSGNDLKLLWKKGKDNLTLPANSIVFVECDLNFRLPNFLALRFNLAISHVHRGLLLGTGPLVDPGFWGKLCIPIHNLTDEPYEISDDDALIWLEFTKTTSSAVNGRLPSGNGYWDIKKFILRAQKPIDPSKDRIGIRSGISKALKDAKNANEKISVSKKAAVRAKNIVVGIGGAAVLAGFIGLTALWYSAISMTNAYRTDIGSLVGKIDTSISDLETGFKNHIDLLDVAGRSEVEAQIYISNLSDMVTALKQSVTDLKITLEAEIYDRRETEARVATEKEESDRLISALTRKISTLCSSPADGEHLDLCSNILAEPVE